MLVPLIEHWIEDEKHLGLLSVFFAAADLAIPAAPLPRLKEAILDGRMTVARKRGHVDLAEDLFIRYVTLRPAPERILTEYIWALETGQTRRTDEALDLPLLKEDQKQLIQCAVKIRSGDHEDAIKMMSELDTTSYGAKRVIANFARRIFGQRQDHLALSSSLLVVLESEPDAIAIRFAVSCAASAEAVNREDLFSLAAARICSDIARIEADKGLFRKHWKDAVFGCMTIFDVARADRIVARAKRKGFACKKERRQVNNVLDDFGDYPALLERAHENILARASGTASAPASDMPVVIVPVAAMRGNSIDYSGFRSDIRFVVKSIAQALDGINVPFSVQGRVMKHGHLELNSPYFSYHTVSNNRMGLHFKETDRPSLFSFDRGGYAGWSEFSSTEVKVGPDIDLEDRFFEQDREHVVGNRISKYAQSDIAEVLPEKFVFVALQVVGDAVSSLAYATSVEMLEEVIRVAATHSIDVVVKRHPACKSSEIADYVATLEAKGAVKVATGSIHDLIAKSMAVCVVNSGVGAEALLYEKPVYVFGRADYMAACFVCQYPGDFEAQFSPDRTKLEKHELRSFWFAYRNQYACDLRNRDDAKAWIKQRVVKHLQQAASE